MSTDQNASLHNKVVLLTGASRGLGEQLAIELSRHGVRLALTARSDEELERVASRVRQNGGQALVLPADITRLEDHVLLVARIEQMWGPIDILINNAGIDEAAPFAEHAPERIDLILRTNLWGTLQLTRQVLPGMLARQRGIIVSMASMAGKQGPPYFATYAASKAGLIAWTNALRGELEGTGVRATVVCPTFVSSVGMFAARKVKAPVLLREVSPEQVVRAVMGAIQFVPAEVLVVHGPMRFLLALGVLFPALGNRILRLIGVTRMLSEQASLYRP